MQINHKDLLKQHNTPSNLELVDASGNIRHSYANGRTRPWGIPAARPKQWRHKAKLTDEQITEAQHMRAHGYLLKEIATHLNIGTTHAHRITNANNI